MMVETGARRAFEGVETWIFDLDNTLYPASCRLFDQIDKRMTAFIAESLAMTIEAANALRARYWREYGTTLNGLMRAHGLSPTAFLDYVHDIDLAGVAPAPELGAAIAALPGRKLVHTNGSRGHAARVLAQLDIVHAFDAVYAIEDSDFTPKPKRDAYDRVAKAAALDPGRAAMFEDDARNLIEPHAMGMRTVWTPGPPGQAALHPERPTGDGPHVHFVAEDLLAFTRALV